MRRRGFTMVETLTAIAVVGVLLGILISMLQAHREEARRVACQNNLRNLALAVSNFSIRKGAYPDSSTTGPGRSLNRSWQTSTLSDLDSSCLDSDYDYDLENYAPENRSVTSLRIAIFLCPSSRLSTDSLPSEKVYRIDGTTYPPGSEFARGHYAANWGGGRLPGYGDDFARTVGNFRGLIMPIPPPTPYAPLKRIRPADVTDGLANTVMLGEQRDGQGWAVGGYAGSEFDAAPSPLMPDRPDLRTVISGSFHPGRVNFAFADGSVRGLKGTMDRKVWYALLTRDGGETVTPDAY